MKLSTFLFFLIVITSQITFSQGFMQDGRPPFLGGKIEELEKIKLIETLQLDEETMLKFFSRRKAHQENMREIMQEKDSLILQLENKIKNGNEADYQGDIDNFIKTDEKLMMERSNFIRSLNEIFTEKEIAELIVFEKRFRSEIRKEIIKQGKRKRGRRQQLN